MFSTKNLLLMLILLVASECSSASVTIAGTRIVFPGDAREVSVRTTNKGTSPALVQVWIDDGKANENLDEVKTPFLVTPPIYRIEPGKGQSLRLMYNGLSLPQDRESVFWFNLLEIPPVSDTEKQGKNRLELAFRTRIKVFYRPKALDSDSTEQFSRLNWAVTNDSGHGMGITVTNPTPYYFSFDSGDAIRGGVKTRINMDMVAPGASQTFYAAKGGELSGEINKLTVKVINDYGTAIEKTLIKQPGIGFKVVDAQVSR